MSGKLEKTLNGVFGCPTNGETTPIDFDANAVATSGQLEANQMYRVICTEDCYFGLIAPGETPITASGMYMAADIPEVFSTTTRETMVSVLRRSSAGKLYCTKLKTRAS